MQAVGGYVVVKPIKGQTRKLKSGIEVPAELSDRFVRGVIHSTSDIGKNEFGLSDEQEILYDKHAGHEVKAANGVEYKVITVRDVAVVL